MLTDIQVLLSVLSALVLLLTALGTVVQLLRAQLKSNHFSERQKTCIFLKAPGLLFPPRGAEGAVFSHLIS